MRILTKDKNLSNLVSDQGLGSPYIIAKSCQTGLKTVIKVTLWVKIYKNELETSFKKKYQTGTESVQSGKLTLVGKTHSKELSGTVSQISQGKYSFLTKMILENVKNSKYSEMSSGEDR